ncbi:DUF461 domain-containing protein [Streptomyces sp. NPDC086787]|uniref:DUF461 domain-containing protein n=1 Tax=Streptomyces sp. NPDC086787 TaxID=3365759 RepID=UPI0037FDF4F1
MSSSIRRGALAASALAFSIAALAGCAAGNNAQTLEVKPDNAATSVGGLKVQNATVITQPDLTSDGPAVISATIFNNGPDEQTLESLAVPGTGKTATLSPAKGGSLTIKPGTSLILGGKGNASAVLPSSREAVKDGNAQKITFSFSKTGDVSLRAFVVPAKSYFTGWGPSEIPSAPAQSQPSGQPSSGQSASSGAPAAGSSGSHAPASSSSSSSSSDSSPAAGH